MKIHRLPIPAETLDKHIGILGKTGSGKSNLAKVVAEWLLSKRHRLAVIDPTGTWWGLRSNAAGDGPGFPVVVFGGAHGDMAVTGAHGAAIAEAVGTSSTPAVIDLRAMTVGDRTRFFTAFAETLLARNQGPLTLVIDEAHLFMPQQNIAGGRDVPRNAMLHAANNLVSLGRSAGLRIVLISQRASKVHKDSLTQVETLVAFRMLAPQDRNAVMDWIGEWADPGEGRRIVGELPSLPTGTGWVWAPEIGLLEKRAFPLAATLDTGAAPDGKRRGSAPVLAPIDLARVEKGLEKIAEEARANDPRELKAQVVALQRELAAAKTAPDAREADKAALDAARQDGFAEGAQTGRAVGEMAALEALASAFGLIRGAGERLAAIGADLVNAADDFDRRREETAAAVASGGGSASLPRRAPVRTAPTPRVHRGTPAPASIPPAENDTPAGLPAPLQRILDAAAWWQALGVAEPSYPQIGFRAGYAPKGGTFNRYLSDLRSRGLILTERRRVSLTAEGERAAASPDAPPSAEELRATILATIDGPLARILGPLIEAWPQPLPRDALGDRSGYEASGGTFNRYLSSLRSLELVVNGPDRSVAAQDWMFE